MGTLKQALTNLVSTMNYYDLYQKNDEVDMGIKELSNIIDEVEKRMQCVANTNKDIRDTIFNNQSKIESAISYDDLEVIQRSIYDIDIAIDLTNNEPIENNWYKLFSEPKKVEEVEVVVLIPKGSIVEWKETKQYYSAKGGAKARVTQDYTIKNAFNDNYLMVEWLDDNANFQENGGYERDDFKEEFELPTPPTELCKTPQTHEFVKDIIAKLKVIDVDGETMQYILKEVGMEDQMLRQLIMNSSETDTKDLLEEKRILSNQGKLISK